MPIYGGKMRRNVYEMIYARLQEIGILDENGMMQADYLKFKSPGLMDLNVDKLTDDTIALAHNGKQNGDVRADPDVQVRVNRPGKMAELSLFKMIISASSNKSILNRGNTTRS